MKPIQQKKVKSKMVHDVLHAVESVDKHIGSVIKQTDSYIEPVRKSVLHRFPTLFIVLTAFGVAATFFGFERLIMTIPFLYDRPLLILFVGIGILMGTGTLYKKLR